MALDPDGLDAARAMEENGIEADVKWVTIAPGGKFFLPRMGAKGAEFFMVRRPEGGGHCSEVGMAGRPPSRVSDWGSAASCVFGFGRDKLRWAADRSRLAC